MGYAVKLPPELPNRKPAGPKRPPTLEEIFKAASAGRPPLPKAPHPSEELSALLDRLEALAERPGARAERSELAERIMDVFHDYPGQAPGWQRAWRAMHRAARVARKRGRP
jgi:hypothetical protein